MAEPKTNASRRCADALCKVLDAQGAGGKNASVDDRAQREAVLQWFSRLDDKTVVETLHKLYRLAERDARERAHGPGGIGLRMVRLLTRRLRIR